MNVNNEVFQNSRWLSAEELAARQENPVQGLSLLRDWVVDRRVFRVEHDGRDYYARYQFDSSYQPLPVIKDVLEAYGEYTDAWSVAAWFYFPNGWISSEHSETAVPVPPKDALQRPREVVNAARNRKGTYVA